MNQVITLLEQELERQDILGISQRAEMIRKYAPEYTPEDARQFADKIQKAIKILKRHKDHDPEKDGFDTNVTY